MFWNCACLIADSGGDEGEEIEGVEYEEFNDFTSEVENFVYDDEEEDDENEEENNETKKVVKKKAKTTNFGKIATAIGKMNSIGISIDPPSVNTSKYTFYPNIEKNSISHGLSGITKIGEEIIQTTIENRPYYSIQDYTSKVKINKPQIINLIKAGAFDEFGKREILMKDYVSSIADQKKKITLQNMKMLIDFGLLPESLNFEIRVYNFNKYLKKNKSGDLFLLDQIALNFYSEYFNMDYLSPTDVDGFEFTIRQAQWKQIYDKQMDNIRKFIKPNHDELLNTLNGILYKQTWDKYCLGNISQWEMEAISHYSHAHELHELDEELYNISDFNILPNNPDVDKVIMIKGKEVPLYRISRIAGTVLDKDKAKRTVTLLTTTGVVTIKIFGDVFAKYDRQISEKDPITGKKKVLEKSWFSRGNKIIVSGIKKENMFIAKKYAKTPFHLIELIKEIRSDGSVYKIGERLGEEEV